MARVLSLRSFLFTVTSFSGLLACTSILGDFEVGPSGTTPDAGGDTTTADVTNDQIVADAPDGSKPTGFAGARQVVTGARHTCALANLGEVFCWGDNSQGQLAQPPSVTRLTKPRKVDFGGVGVVAKALAAGANHTCVIMMNDDIQCWGLNASGQTGTGDFNQVAPPHVVRAATNPVQRQWALVAAGENHTCAIDQGGQTYCFGSNDGKQSGQIGAANVALATAAGAEKVGFLTLTASGKHTCGAKAGASNTFCWGSESKGALGNGAPSTDSYDTATAVVFPGETKELVSGGGHTCLLDAQGDARCWGDNAMGQLGVPSVDSLDKPGPGKVGMITLAEIAAGGDTTCGIASTGRVLACVGSNSQGQLGRGGQKDTSAHPEPQPVQRDATSGLPLDGVAHVSVGREHVCAIVGTGGEIMCWGNGADGQLGDGTSGGDARTLPVKVAKPE